MLSNTLLRLSHKSTLLHLLFILPVGISLTYLSSSGKKHTEVQWNSNSVEDFFKKGIYIYFPKIFGTALGSISDFLQQSTSSKTFNHLNCWQDISWKCWKTENKKAHNSTEITNRKWETEPAQYYLKCQNVLIINGIWLETVWSWSPAVSISRARQISSYKDLGIYLRSNLCLNPKKKVKVTFYSCREHTSLLQNILLFNFSFCIVPFSKSSSVAIKPVTVSPLGTCCQIKLSIPRKCYSKRVFYKSKIPKYENFKVSKA